MERDRTEEPLDADYNVAPTKPVYAVVARTPKAERAGGGRGGQGHDGAEHEGRTGKGGPDQGDPDKSASDKSASDKSASDKDGGQGRPKAGERSQPGPAVRELRVVRWGLVPVWAKDPSIGSRMINARAETVDSKPAYRRAFARRRCLLPADGYYEWQPVTEGGKTRKQPYFISRKDGSSLAMAGIYELWRDRDLPDDHERAWMWTTSVITTDAPDELGRIHDRMPMIVDPGHWTEWLDPDNEDPAGLRSLLAPATTGGLVWHPVSTAVNSVRHNGPELVEPITLDSAAGEQENGGSEGKQRKQGKTGQPGAARRKAGEHGADDPGAADSGLSGADERQEPDGRDGRARAPGTYPHRAGSVDPGPGG